MSRFLASPRSVHGMVLVLVASMVQTTLGQQGVPNSTGAPPPPPVAQTNQTPVPAEPLLTPREVPGGVAIPPQGLPQSPSPAPVVPHPGVYGSEFVPTLPLQYPPPHATAPPFAEHAPLPPTPEFAPTLTAPGGPNAAVLDPARVDTELCKRRCWWDKMWHSNRAACLADLTSLIDELDRDIFKVGVVAVKAADVWGQNRMTKFRVEYENEMAKNLPLFRPILNARVRQADVATLTSSTALGMALPSGSTTNARGGSTVTQVTPAAPSITLNTPSPLLAAETPVLGAVADKAANPLSAVFLDLNRSAANDTTAPIGLEPTIVLDEQSRFLLHLQELRRINTGDDTTDMPGYGLYLIRIPVSLLPGPRTFMGKGASVTVQASHYLTPDLLPTTFSDFATNDLAGVLAPYLASFLALDEIRVLTPDQMRQRARLYLESMLTLQGKGNRKPGEMGVVQASYQSGPPGNPTQGPGPVVQPAQTGPSTELGAVTQANSAGILDEMRSSTSRAANRPTSGTSPVGPAQLKSAAISEIDEIYGPVLLWCLAADVKETQEHVANHDFSIRDWLREEIKATYRYLHANANDPHFSFEWVNLVGRLVETRNYVELDQLRYRWVTSLPGYNQPMQLGPNGEGLTPLPRPLETLAYGIIVEQYALDKILKTDMEGIAQQKGGLHGNPQEETFYALNPSANARALYNSYVAAKWPIRVFAVDPDVDQQNVQDVSSLRRELQIALAVALSTGQMNFNQTLNYARRLEVDIETIGLNRTAVGFGAGENTFGWKFYPRVQTLQRESNPRAIFDLLLFNGPGPYYDVRHRKIEPGRRDCTALVMMPNFVPYLRLDSTTNWFGLTGRCAEQVLDSREMLELGHKVQLAKGGLAHLADTCGYRPTDLQGLASRVDQLETQLPIQTQLVQLAYENTLSGPEVYAEGYSHLAPQLLDWFGTAASGQEFSVFVSGHHFSVHETRVIAGGVALAPEKYFLLSRDLMRITVPANAHVDTRPVRELDRHTKQIVTRMLSTIDIHVASPNGDSNHLLVELPSPNPTDCRLATGLHWRLPTVYTTHYTFGTAEKPTFTVFPGDTFLPPTNELVIDAPPGSFAPSNVSLVITVETGGKVIFTNTYDNNPNTTSKVKAPVNYDATRNAFFILGNDFMTVKNDIDVGLNAALNNKHPGDQKLQEPTDPLVVSGKLVIGNVVYPIDNKLTISLLKVATNP